MNLEKEKALSDTVRRNPFWVCLAVFFFLACDQGFRLVSLAQQRQQLNQAESMMAQNKGALVQAQQLEFRLQSFSLDLLKLAPTNANAKQIVQDFNIQWNPPAAASTPMPAGGPQTK